MDTRQDLEATLTAELWRVVGSERAPAATPFDELSDEQLVLGTERLRMLPAGIGFAEMMRRVQQVPPGERIVNDGT